MKKIIIATLVGWSAGAAFAAPVEVASDEAFRRIVGTCLVKQAVALDNGTQSIDVLSRAVVAGCNPVIVSYLAGAKPSAIDPARVLVGNSRTSEPVFGMDNILTERAANVIQWLRSDVNRSALRKPVAKLASR